MICYDVLNITFIECVDFPKWKKKIIYNLLFVKEIFSCLARNSDLMIDDISVRLFECENSCPIRILFTQIEYYCVTCCSDVRRGPCLGDEILHVSLTLYYMLRRSGRGERMGQEAFPSQNKANFSFFDIYRLVSNKVWLAFEAHSKVLNGFKW